MISFNQLEPRRLFTAGELDASFGINGSKSLHETGDVPGTWLSVISLPGDKYLAAGVVRKTSGADPTDLLLARYLKNGQLDPTFGTNGFAIINAGNDEYVVRAYATSDGYLIQGKLGLTRATFKFTTTGVLDTTFGGGDGILDGLSVKAVQSDGKLVAVGGTVEGTTFGRFLPDGSPDPSFNSGTLIDLAAETPLRSSASGAEVLLQKSGKIIAYATGPQDGDFSVDSHRTVFARWDASGHRDFGFAKNGLLIVQPAKAPTLDGNDRIVMAQRSVYRGMLYRRYTADGAVDGSFKEFQTVEPVKIIVDASNRLLIGTGNWVYRYNTQGVYDRRLNFFAFSSLNRFQNDPFDFTLDSKQMIVAAGQRNSLPTIQRIQTVDDGRAILFNKKNRAIEIYGTSKADRLDVTYSYNKQTLTLVLNGKSQTYTLGDVRSIYFDAGAGNDVVRFNGKYTRFAFLGGDGDDDCRVISADRYAFLYGGKGNDYLDASGIFAKFAGHGWLQGDDGNDTLIGSNEQDDLYGNRGNDVLKGFGNNDKLDGGSGDDYLDGGDGSDNIRGSAGNDTLIGGAGFDNLSGGAGNDLFYTADDKVDNIGEPSDGTSGYDIAYVDQRDANGQYNISTEVEKIVIV